MAIDADLSAGLIDEAAARARRKALEDESSFFGAMDGASKFVRGDAIAALLITFINVVGGIVIGVAQMGMSFSDAAKAYTLLTCGDGLVSQVPALIVSTAAGLLVSKAGVRGAADKALGRQLSNYPKALGMSAAVMGAIALLPGIPMLPFLALAGGAAWLARKVDRDMKARLAAAASAAAPAANASDAPKDEPIADVLKIDDLKVEVGYALVPLVNAADGNDRLTEQIKALRRQLAAEAGFVMPSVRILDNVSSTRTPMSCASRRSRPARPDLPRPVHGDGPDGRAGAAARPAHARADLRPAGDLDRRRPGCATRRSCAATPSSTPRPS